MHTNPILICFCSILYYPDLAEHIRRYRIEKEFIQASEVDNFDDDVFFSLKKFHGKLATELVFKEKRLSKKSNYNQKMLNRWHLLLRLNVNKELIPFRSHNLRKKQKNQPISLLKKLIFKVSKIKMF